MTYRFLFQLAARGSDRSQDARGNGLRALTKPMDWAARNPRIDLYYLVTRLHVCEMMAEPTQAAGQWRRQRRPADTRDGLSLQDLGPDVEVRGKGPAPRRVDETVPGMTAKLSGLPFQQPRASASQNVTQRVPPSGFDHDVRDPAGQKRWPQGYGKPREAANGLRRVMLAHPRIDQDMGIEDPEHLLEGRIDGGHRAPAAHHGLKVIESFRAFRENTLQLGRAGVKHIGKCHATAGMGRSLTVMEYYRVSLAEKRVRYSGADVSGTADQDYGHRCELFLHRRYGGTQIGVSDRVSFAAMPSRRILSHKLLRLIASAFAVFPICQPWRSSVSRMK